MKMYTNLESKYNLQKKTVLQHYRKTKVVEYSAKNLELHANSSHQLFLQVTKVPRFVPKVLLLYCILKDFPYILLLQSYILSHTIYKVTTNLSLQTLVGKWFLST